MSFSIAQTAAVARASAAPSARPTARRAANVAPMRAARVNVVAAVDLNGARRSARAPPIPLDVAFASNVAASDRRSTLSRATVSLVRQIPPGRHLGPPQYSQDRLDASPVPATRELTPTISSPLIPPISPQPSPSRTPRRSSWTPTPSPIPSVWSVALQELLVTQHFVRFSTKYTYSKLSSLGFVSVFDQLFEGFPSDEDKDAIFESFVKALEEDPETVRADAAELAAFAESADGVDAIVANPVFATLKSANDDAKFAYSRYDAVGLFRMLELAGAADPTALETMANASGLQLKKVNGDLALYKSLLSKLAAAKELQAEIFEREKRKTAEREAKKAEAAAKKAAEEA